MDNFKKHEKDTKKFILSQFLEYELNRIRVMLIFNNIFDIIITL